MSTIVNGGTPRNGIEPLTCQLYYRALLTALPLSYLDLTGRCRLATCFFVLCFALYSSGVTLFSCSPGAMHTPEIASAFQPLQCPAGFLLMTCADKEAIEI